MVSDIFVPQSLTDYLTDSFNLKFFHVIKHSIVWEDPKWLIWIFYFRKLYSPQCLMGEWPQLLRSSSLLIPKWDKDKFADKSNKPKFFVQNSSAKFTIRPFDQTLKFTLHKTQYFKRQTIQQQYLLTTTIIIHYLL